MQNIGPSGLLIKPHLDPGNASDCELEALKFLKSWKRARDRQAVQRRRSDAEEKIRYPDTPTLLLQSRAGRL